MLCRLFWSSFAVYFFTVKCQCIKIAQIRSKVTLSSRHLVTEAASKVTSSRTHWTAQIERCSLRYLQGKKTKKIFHLCRYGWNHPWIILINRMPNFCILRAIKQINYLEMVILHASPLESLSQTTLGLPSAVPGSLVKQHFTFFIFPVRKGESLTFWCFWKQQKYPSMPCGREYAAFHGAWQNHVQFVLFYHMVRSSTKENPMNSQSQS